MDISIVGVLLFMFCTIVACFVVLFLTTKRQSDKLVNDLINKLMAKDLAEYAAAKLDLDTTPADKRKELKIENNLAVKAAAIEQARVERELTGRPI